MNCYYAAIALALAAFMLVRELRKPVDRDGLEFKFRTGQITHEEMAELEILRAADRVVA